MNPRRLDYIDALRGIAVTGVIMSHVKNQFPDIHWRIVKVIKLGAHGVQLFFVASALTLMLSWSARRDGAVPFYLRRLFRIAPMFWLATALYGGLNAAGHWLEVAATWWVSSRPCAGRLSSWPGRLSCRWSRMTPLCS